MNDQLLKIFVQKPYLAWDIKDPKSLSEKSMLEHLINYGDWDDILNTIQILGIEKTTTIFNESISNPRNNFSPKTINFFKLFLPRYAQGNIK